MKKKVLLLVAPLLVLFVVGVGYAHYVKGYEVVAIKENQVEIKSVKGEVLVVPDKSGEFRKGQRVEYDKKSNAIRKEIEGC